MGHEQDLNLESLNELEIPYKLQQQQQQQHTTILTSSLPIYEGGTLDSMKPVGAEEVGGFVGGDVGELVVQLGMLVVESRLPASSIKGREDGPHCPHSVGDWPKHVCDQRQALCMRACEMRKQIQSLWRNNVPVCVEVLVFPDCQHGRQKAMISNVPPPVTCDDSYLLLEQWTIQSVAMRSNETRVTTKALFQAMRSYLHFSQLSAWLNLTHGTEPTCIGYRISPPAEFCTSVFTTPPEVHTFPLAWAGGRTPAVRVSLARLPRIDDIPQLICRELHRPTTSSSSSSSSASSAPVVVSSCLNTVIPSSSLTTSSLVQSSSSSSSAEGRTLVVSGVLSSNKSLPAASPEACGVLESKTHFDPESDKLGEYNLRRCSGRLGKCECESCNIRMTGRDMRLVHPAVSSLRQASSVTSRSTTDLEESDSGRSTPVAGMLGFSEVKKVSAPVSISAQWKRKSGPAVIKDCTDSDGSLPDFDLFLSSTLANRRDPLSPQEMENQLRSLCPTKSHHLRDTAQEMRFCFPHKDFTSDLEDVDDISDAVFKGFERKVTRKAGSKSFCCQGGDFDDDVFDLNLSRNVDDRGDVMKTVNCERAGKESDSNVRHVLGSSKLYDGLRLESELTDRNELASDLDSDSGYFSPRVKSSKSNLSHQIESSEVSCMEALKRATFTVGDEEMAEPDCDVTKKQLTCDAKVKNGGNVANRKSLCETDWKTSEPGLENGAKLKNGAGNKVEKVAKSRSVVFIDGAKSNSVVTCDVKNSDLRNGDVKNGDLKNGDFLSPVVDVKAELTCKPEVIESTPVKLLHKSASCPPKREAAGKSGSGWNLANCLRRTVLKKEILQQQLLQQQQQLELEEQLENSKLPDEDQPKKSAPISMVRSGGQSVPTRLERDLFMRNTQRSSSVIFHSSTHLPLQSSPVPTKRMPSGSFDYDESLHNNVRAIKNSLSCISLDKQEGGEGGGGKTGSSSRLYSTSAPASTNCLLGNFEESLINGRIEPAGVVDGFTVDIGASGSFCPKHLTLPVTAFFFSLSDDNAPSPYLGHIDLEGYSKRGYHVPSQGTVQVTLFNPNKTVVKMFVVTYDVSDMPPNSHTFLRQRTLYMPVRGSPSDLPDATIFLRYLIHLRYASSKTNKIYLHTDIRVIFARDKFELDSRVANYEMRSFTEGPVNPKYSPKK